MKSPCYQCKERSVACHDTCSNYVDWKIKQRHQVNGNAKDKAHHLDYVDYAVKGYDERLRRHKGRVVVGKR